MMQNHTPINPVPMVNLPTHVKAPKKLRKIKNHVWGKTRKGKTTCKRCGLVIDAVDRPFNTRCDYRSKNPFIISTQNWQGFWKTVNPPKKKQTKRKEPIPVIYDYNRKQVVCGEETLKILDLVGRVGIPETARYMGTTSSNIHNRIYGVCDRLEQGQAEINRVRGFMSKYPIIKRLLTPKTLKPTKRDLEPDLYEDEEAERRV